MAGLLASNPFYRDMVQSIKLFLRVTLLFPENSCELRLLILLRTAVHLRHLAHMSLELHCFFVNQLRLIAEVICERVELDVLQLADELVTRLSQSLSALLRVLRILWNDPLASKASELVLIRCSELVPLSDPGLAFIFRIWWRDVEDFGLVTEQVLNLLERLDSFSFENEFLVDILFIVLVGPADELV